MPRLIAACLFTAMFLFASWRADAHAADDAVTISLNCDLKAPGHLEQTVRIPVGFLVSEVFGAKTTLLSLRDREAECRTKITAWMAQHNPILADGTPLAPELISMKAISTLLPEEMPFPGFIADLAEIDDTMLKGSTVAQIAFAYHPPTDARAITVRWTRHIPQPTAESGLPVQPVPPISLVFFNEATHRIAELTPDEPEWIWRTEAVVKAPASSLLSGKWEPRTWRIPVAAPAIGICLLLIAPCFARSGRRLRTASLIAFLTLTTSGLQWVSGYGCATIPSPLQKKLPRPTQAEARTLFSDLLLGVYKAFDYNKDADIYDALAQCVDGPLLEQVYRDVHGALVLDETEGGAICRVDKVDVQQVDLLPPVPGDPPDALRLSCAWTVRGIVSHWNHTHTRANAYAAEYTLAPCTSPDGPRWKITACKVTTQKPIEAKP